MVPKVLRIRELVEGGKQAVAISDELILLHEPASNITERFVVVPKQGTCCIPVSLISTISWRILTEPTDMYEKN